jgi:hypothetical protein
MADPTKYVIDYSFTDFQTGTPSRPLPAPELDTELANIENSIDEIVEAIKDVRRSDGAIQNDSVTLDSLNDEVFLGFAGLTANLVIPTGDWAPMTVYLKGSIVSINGGSAMAKMAHTSGASYDLDFAAGKWQTLATQGVSGLGTGDIVAANNGSDFPSKATVRTNLELGSMATQAAGAVTITGGTIAGITDLAIADGGTGASTAPQALINFGLSATAAELNILDGVTATAAQINAGLTNGLVAQSTFSGSELIVAIPSQYDAFTIEYDDFLPTGSGEQLLMQFGTGTIGSPVWQTTGYAFQATSAIGAGITASNGTGTNFGISTTQSNSSSFRGFGIVWVRGFNRSGAAGILSRVGGVNTAPSRVLGDAAGWQEDTATRTLIRLFVASGTAGFKYRIIGHKGA